MDTLDFLDGPQGSNDDARPADPAPVADAPAEPVADAAPEPIAAQPRGPDGKFAPKDAAPAVEPIKPPEGYVPLEALKEVREELKALKAANQPKPAEPAPVPDMYEDPDGFVAYQNSQLLNVKLDISEEMTRAQHGDEATDQARDWALAKFQSNPAFRNEVLSQRNPWGYAVQQFKRDQSLSKLGDDPKDIEGYLAWKTAQAALQQQPAAQPAPTPTPSIASAASAGGHQQVAVGPDVAFNQLFG